MRRMWPILALTGALFLAAGCDELEEINIDLGGYGLPLLYGGYYDQSPRGWQEEVWIEEECYVEEYYVEDWWYEDEWALW